MTDPTSTQQRDTRPRNTAEPDTAAPDTARPDAAPAGLLGEDTDLTPELQAELQAVPLFHSLRPQELGCLGRLSVVRIESGTTLARPGDPADAFWVLLTGTIEVNEATPEGPDALIYVHRSGSAFGEVPLLASIPNPYTLRVAESARLLRFSEAAFWQLMTDCPSVRRAVLRTLAQRLQKMQHNTVHQEKMAALGTMAAGLMHELNNPGAAARRAATLLRDRIFQLQDLSARLHRQTMSGAQLQCLDALVHEALQGRATLHLSSLEQSDAEEAMADWLSNAGVQEPWKVAATLVETGLDVDDLACSHREFHQGSFADAISWIEAFVSSAQLVETIEQSIGRITELVKAVKSYAYEGAGQLHAIDLNQSIHAALVILGHKLRNKEIQLVKELSPNLPTLHCACRGLNQIWTNLIDNAIDAVSHKGRILIRTWAEDATAGPSRSQELCILVADNGSGITPEIQPHIFDPFFTTKPVGVGTGLGLGIVHRLVEQSRGSIHFTSDGSGTEFIIRLPLTESTCSTSLPRV